MQISIIMPAYNSERTIKRALDSVTSILCDDIELVIVDDGSTDNTFNICNSYQEKYPSIKIVKSQNMGVSNARNKGMDLSAGKYIMFMDSDDENLLNKEDFDILKKNPEFVLFSYSVKKAFEKKEKFSIVPKEYIKAPLLPRYIIENYDLFSSPWAKIYKKDLIKKNKLQFPNNQKYGEDTVFVFSFLSFIKNEILVSNIISYKYYLYSNSASGFKVYHNKMNQYLYNILKSYLAMNGERQYIEKLANYLFDKAIMHYYLNNNFQEFKINYLETYDYFKEYMNPDTINNEVFKYKYPVNEKILEIYTRNLKYKLKNNIKKILWR